MYVGFVYDRFLERHDPGPGHPEQPGRARWVADALAEAGLLQHVQPIACQPAPLEVIGWVHEPAYVELLREVCEQGFSFIGDSQTRICRESFEVARWAVGGVLAAGDEIIAGHVGRAFCAIRPPGHHAQKDLAGGYCLLNNVAIGAEYLIRRHALKRIAIVDWDVHHGNGTQHIFEDRDDVLYLSLHETPRYQYPGTGYETEVGRERGTGFTVNVPLPPGTGDPAYRQAFADQLMPALRAFAPQFILVSAGFDAAGEDRTADLNLEPATYAWMTRELVAAADESCQGRLLSILEGGYEPSSLKRCAVAHLRAMMEND
jgi:acetoin utilization deacetylase AcuC-like enzyme